MRYYGKKYPSRRGMSVNVKKRIGHSAAYEIEFALDGLKHDCMKRFLKEL